MPKGDKLSKWEEVGTIDVDAGICWIGDPCYILHKDINAKEEHNLPPKGIGTDWHSFCDLIPSEKYIGPCPDCKSLDELMIDGFEPGKLLEEYKKSKDCKTCGGDHRLNEYFDFWQLNQNHGGPGLGVVVRTGWGDGSYPVEVRRRGGRVAEVRVRFM